MTPSFPVNGYSYQVINYLKQYADARQDTVNWVVNPQTQAQLEMFFQSYGIWYQRLKDSGSNLKKARLANLSMHQNRKYAAYYYTLANKTTRKLTDETSEAPEIQHI